VASGGTAAALSDRATSSLAPSPLSSVGGSNLTIPANNPYNLFGVPIGVGGAAGAPGLRTRLDDIGNRYADNTVDTYRFVIGFRGQVLIVDQLAPIDPLPGFELDRFERARDPSHTRLLPEADIRALLDANGLVLRRSQQLQEARDVDGYLDLAGCAGEARERALSVAPESYTATIGWYLAARQPAS